jgi:hypothetical protein
MNTPGCDDVAHLIDLFAADECGPNEARAVRAHLDECDACRDALAESHRLVGLLDIHFREPAAMSRLAGKLKAEARRGTSSLPRILSFHRFAAVAALLLVTFGLGLLLMTPPGAAPRQSGLQLALAEPEVRAVPAPPEHGPREMVKMLELSRDVKAMLTREADKPDHWPLPPRVDLDMVVSNPGTMPAEIEVGGPGFRYEIDLKGPARVRRHSPDRPEYVPFPPGDMTIKPGGSLRLRLERLAAQVGGRVWYLYPGAGEYTLRVRLKATARRGGRREDVRLESPPWRLRVK